jgi:hypothetical protein
MGGLNVTQRRTRTWALSLLVAVGLFGGTGGAWGQNLSDLMSQAEVQEVTLSPTARTFGTANTTAHVIFATEFEPFTPVNWNYTITPRSKWADLDMFAGGAPAAGAVETRRTHGYRCGRPS